ncbi:hypothetical protein LSAT2_020460 [Lamellibrachia satsuma]|nr:hypothetical protein LSAT2_020460 [Lamellibrachia satsuma]
MQVGGQNCDGFSCFKLGESTRGSKANYPSRNEKSFGKVTSIYSPSQIVALSIGALSTHARRTVEWLDTLPLETYKYTVPSPITTWRLSNEECTSQYLDVQIVDHQAFKFKLSPVTSESNMRLAYHLKRR